MYSSI